MKRPIGILIVLLFLVGICVAEELIVSNAIGNVKKISDNLYKLSATAENVNTEEIITKTDNLLKYWKGQEVILCFFINYKDMSEMSNELVRMTSYAKDNIKEEYVASLSLLLYYCDTFDHITGFSLQNIF